MAHETAIGTTAAGVGGFVKFAILQANSPELPYAYKLLEASFTAGVCALVGLLVKDIYTRFKKEYSKNEQDK